MADAITKNVKSVWYDAGNRPWRLTHRPFRVSPHIYYVGNTWVGAYLIATEEGLAIIDTTVFESVYMVIESIWELGFDPRDLKHIFLTHCHCDHVGGVMPLKEISDADVYMSKEDDQFQYEPANKGAGTEFKQFDTPVDHHYNDDSPIQFGGLEICTILTPGHTPGTTSFFITDRDEQGRKLIVGLHGGVGPNTMSDEYLKQYGLDPTLRQQFIDGCESLKSHHVDITIASHPAHGDLFNRIGDDPADYTSLIDPSEWSRFLQVRKEFAEQLNPSAEGK